MHLIQSPGVISALFLKASQNKRHSPTGANVSAKTGNTCAKFFLKSLAVTGISDKGRFLGYNFWKPIF